MPRSEEETAAVLRAMLADVDELAEKICDTSEAEVEGYRIWAQAGHGERLRRSIVTILASFASSDHPRIPYEIAKVGAERARQGLPLDAIPSVWLIMTRRVWHWICQQATDPDEPGPDLLAVWSSFLQYVDESVAVITSSYVEEQSEAHVAEVMMRRAALDEGLRATRWEDVRDALVTLGLPEKGTRVLALRPEHARGDETRLITSVVNRMPIAAGMRSPWTILESLGLTLVHPDVDEDMVRAAVAEVGLPAGLSGRHGTHELLGPLSRQADLASRRASADNWLVVADQLSLIDLAAGTVRLSYSDFPHWMRDFFEQDARHDGQWADSVRALSRTNFNIQEAARLLYVHPNTLYYRIDAIHRACGIDIRHARPFTDLTLALACLDTSSVSFPPEVRGSERP